MTVESVLAWLQETDIATDIREGSVLFPWIECGHVLAITFVVGSIVAVDLRLLGVSSLDRPVSRLSRDILPWTWAAFLVAVATGGLLFASKAVQYGANRSFQFKIAFLALAGLNMAIFHLTIFRSVGSWDTDRYAPRAARLAGVLSLLLWFAIVVCGRVIGFTTVDLPS